MLISFTTRERAGGGEGEGFPRMFAEEQGQCVENDPPKETVLWRLGLRKRFEHNRLHML